MPLVISVACRKGGVGKTTTAIGVAQWFAMTGHRTAVIELDEQANVPLALGCKVGGPGAAELMLGKPVDPLVVPGIENLVLYCGNDELLGSAVDALDAEHLGDVVATLPYDVVVVDCPPKGEHLERLGMTASQVALLALSPHPLALQGAIRLRNIIGTRLQKARPAPSRLALVCTRFDERRVLDRQLRDSVSSGQVEDLVGIPLMLVRNDETISRDMADSTPFVLAHPDGRGSQDYRAIVTWIKGTP